MGRLRSPAVLLLAVLCLAAGPADAGEPTRWNKVLTEQGGTAEWRHYVAMRDGVRLDTNIFLPGNTRGPNPTVLIRSPYPAEESLDASVAAGFLPTLLKNGYAIVFQSERGRNWSEGDYSFLAGAANDGYDTIDWIARQPWSNGKVATYGCSSDAENQLALSVASHPAHAAAIAQAPGAGIGRIGPFVEQGNFFRGGAIQLLFAGWHSMSAAYGGAGSRQRPRFPADLDQADRLRLSRLFSLQRVPTGGDPASFFRHLPVSEMVKAVNGPITDWDAFSTRTPADAAWQATNFINEGDRPGVPMLWVYSWYDMGVAPNIAFYQYARENSVGRGKANQYMVVSPVTHCAFGQESANTKVGERELGDARFDYTGFYLRWLDYWTKGVANGVDHAPPVQYYAMGRNRWVQGDRFPVGKTRRLRLFLDSDGRANGAGGDGRLSFHPPSHERADAFVYDPVSPVPTRGGNGCCMGPVAPAGSFDQAAVEARPDVLVYSTPPLKEDVEVTGFIDVTLYVSSDAKDTDFTAKLVDVYPDGRAFNLDDTILRARYRDGYDRPQPMEAGRVYRLRLGPMVTSNHFAAGHRIRLEVSSSNFPRFDRNLNTGGANFNEDKPVVARNSVHHSAQYGSFIELPTIVPVDRNRSSSQTQRPKP